MSEEREQDQPAETPKKEYSEALLQSAIERLKTRGDSTRRFACMGLPAPVFHDLCARLMDQTLTVRATAEWLQGQIDDAPTRSSVERFSDALNEAYDLAIFARDRGQVERFVEELTGDDPVAKAMAVNSQLTVHMSDLLSTAGRTGPVEQKLLETIVKGVRAVSQTVFDKQNLDARLKALEKQVEERDLRMQQVRVKAEAAVKALEVKQGGKRQITADDIAEVRKAVFG